MPGTRLARSTGMTDDGPRGGERHRPADRQSRRDTLIAEIAARLRHVCEQLSDAEFSRLVADIADMRLRFAAIDAGYGRARAQADKPPADIAKPTEESGPDANP